MYTGGTMGKDQIKQRVRQAVCTMPFKEHVRKMYLFGSQLHGMAKEDSDVDLLVELRGIVGYFDLVRMEKYLEESLRMPIDLVTPECLSKYIRPKVLREKELVYDA